MSSATVGLLGVQQGFHSLHRLLPPQTLADAEVVVSVVWFVGALVGQCVDGVEHGTQPFDLSLCQTERAEFAIGGAVSREGAAQSGHNVITHGGPPSSSRGRCPSVCPSAGIPSGGFLPSAWRSRHAAVRSRRQHHRTLCPTTSQRPPCPCSRPQCVASREVLAQCRQPWRASSAISLTTDE